VPFAHDPATMTVNSPFWVAGQQSNRAEPRKSASRAWVLRQAGYAEPEIPALRAEAVIS
jgi:hypothetical protein